MAFDLESYIRRAAAARGINPDIAVRVAKSEGGLKDPVRRAEYVKGGYREPSYGPFQLLVGGAGTGFPAGMGNDALRSGIDPRDPNQAPKAIDFALDQAKNNGWGAWYGAKAQGITGKMGIGGAPAMSPQAADFVKNNPQPGGFGLPVEQAAGLAPATNAPSGGILADAGIPKDVGEAIGSILTAPEGERSPLQKMFDAFAKTPEAPPVRFGPMGDARQTGDALLKQLNAPKMGDLLLKQRMGLA